MPFVPNSTKYAIPGNDTSLYGGNYTDPWKGMNINQIPLGKLSDYQNFLGAMATQQGPTGYAQGQNWLAESQANESAYKNAADVNSAAGSAANRMAMRGGITAGSKQRLQQQAQQQTMEGNQSIYDTLAQGNLGILASDEDRKKQALQDMIGIKSGQLLGQYQADTARNSGGIFGGGGFLGTGFRF